MAFGAILGQKPGSVGIGAVVQTYKVAEGVTINPGDLVGLVDEMGPVQVPLSSFSQWATISINENGSPVNYVIANKNYYPEQNTNRILMVRKASYGSDIDWDSSLTSSYFTNYDGSTLDEYLNSTVYNLYDEEVKQAIQSTVIKSLSRSNYNYAISNVSKNVFTLSAWEIYQDPNQLSYNPNQLNFATGYEDGEYISGLYSRVGSRKGNWFRTTASQSSGSEIGVVDVSSNGVRGRSFDNGTSTYVAFTLPTTFMIDSTAPTGNKVLTNAGSQTMGIALKSGTGGDYIDVILSGTIEIDWGTPGQEITSSGVSGFIPAQGILWVSPYWDSDTVTGGYMGTGTYGIDNVNHLAFESTPKEITIVSDDNTMATLDMKTNTAILYSDNEVSVNSITVEPTETGIS